MRTEKIDVYTNKINRPFFIWLTIAAFQITPLLVKAQKADPLTSCKAVLLNDTLTIENNLIKRVFLWNNGRLITQSIVNKTANKTWDFAIPVLLQGGGRTEKNVKLQPDFSIPNLKIRETEGTFSTKNVSQTTITPAYLQAEVLVEEGGLQIKKVFRVYPNSPAIACDFYLRGKSKGWTSNVAALADLRVIESEAARKEGDAEVVVLDKLHLPGRHWEARSVEFFDVTDRNNNLVQEYEKLVYVQELRMKGNLLLLQNKPEEDGLFFLKEAPVSDIQIYYPGFDFTVKTGEVKMVGLGIAPADLSDSAWVRGYSAVTGVSLEKGDYGLFSAIKMYQENLRTLKPGRDEMILSNTWGDRGQDSKINEKFILEELRAGAKLGVTHFQIDDGWQTGRSSNSVFEGGSLKSIWKNEKYWEPDPVKFPNGLKPVVELGKKLGIQISTWFNPSTDSNFKYWEKDADVLINQFKKYGIKTWKIDGVNIANKQADVNFRKLLDKVMLATDNEAVFNLDVTGGRRFGYHYFYEYGNLFLENRYTDFARYYPHYTLRNLWMLSRYVPTQRLQIEFLNNWRNKDKYPADDMLAPGNYSFDYLFAITMFAQPLAWFETSGLPPEAFKTAALIKTYKQHWGKIHEGQVFPVGDEPDGFSWTGFQSVLDDQSGYILVFRENNADNNQSLKTYLSSNKTVSFKHIAGSGKSFSQKPVENSNISFNLPAAKSFALYEYQIQ